MTILAYPVLNRLACTAHKMSMVFDGFSQLRVIFIQNFFGFVFCVVRPRLGRRLLTDFYQRNEKS